MNYKKEYEATLEKARNIHKDAIDMGDSLRAKMAEFFFPELKESEDERIRKALISILKSDFEKDTEIYGISVGDIIAWLEKQGEKHGKSALEAIKEEKADNANKIEPKFKVGQWIVWQDKCYKVNYNGCGYELVDQNGLSTSLEYGTIDENAHIWDITKDAKDGDILASKRTSCVLIFKGRDGTSFISYYNTSIDSNDDWNRVNFLPATKEQRELLFAKMKKDGYKWDVNNKQLIKL